MERLNKIVRRGVFESVEVEWIDDARREGHFNKLSIEEQNEYMDTLYWLDHTHSKVRDRASEVYRSLR